MVNTAGFQTGTLLFQLRIRSGKRALKRYQTNQYEEFTMASAAVDHASDSPTIAAPVIRQNPTKGRLAIINRCGMIPSGRTWRTAIRTTAAIIRVNQGARNIPTVETNFAVA